MRTIAYDVCIISQLPLQCMVASQKMLHGKGFAAYSFQSPIQPSAFEPRDSLTNLKRELRTWNLCGQPGRSILSDLISLCNIDNSHVEWKTRMINVEQQRTGSLISDRTGSCWWQLYSSDFLMSTLEPIKVVSRWEWNLSNGQQTHCRIFIMVRDTKVAPLLVWSVPPYVWPKSEEKHDIALRIVYRGRKTVARVSPF
jgi:hypothetical protein